LKQPNFWHSLQHAWAGVIFTVRTQRNAKIHLVAGVLVISLAVWLRRTPLEFSILVLTVGGVIAGETINTTVEAIVDLLSPEWHESAKVAKDAAAGGVLILSLAAIAVGVFILGPPLWERLLQLRSAS
jgi:diacylglycerol kinase